MERDAPRLPLLRHLTRRLNTHCRTALHTRHLERTRLGGKKHLQLPAPRVSDQRAVMLAGLQLAAVTLFVVLAIGQPALGANRRLLSGVATQLESSAR